MALVGIVKPPDPSVLFFVAIVTQCKKEDDEKLNTQVWPGRSLSAGRAAYLPSVMLATLKRLAGKPRDEDPYEL